VILIITETKTEITAKEKEQAFSCISIRSFIAVVAMLLAILIFCGSLSY